MNPGETLRADRHQFIETYAPTSSHDKAALQTGIFDFGTTWIPPKEVSIAQDIRRSEQFEVNVVVPDELKASLGEVSMLLSATHGQASIPVEIKMGDKITVKAEANLGAKGIALRLGQQVPVAAGEAAEKTFETIAEKRTAFETKWQEIIEKAVAMDHTAIHSLLEGVWAVRRLDSGRYADKTEQAAFRQWLDQRYDKEDQRLLSILEVQGFFSTVTDHAISYQIEQFRAGGPVTPEIISSAMDSVAEQATSNENLGFGDAKTWANDRRYLLKTLADTVHLSLASEVLTNKSRILAYEAAENGDIIGAVAQFMNGPHAEEITFDPQTGTITFASDNIPQALRSVEGFIKKLGAHTAMPTSAEFAEGISAQEEKGSAVLVDYGTLRAKASEAKYTEKAKALIEAQTDRGHVFFSVVGTTNTGKTTLSANVGEHLQAKHPEHELHIYTLADSAKTPEDLVRAIRTVLHRMVFNRENILFVAEDAHLIFKGVTPAQLNTLQSALDMFHKIAEELPVTGGMILNSEQSLPRKALGMWQRLPEIQLSLFRERDIAHNQEMLIAITKLHPDVFAGVTQPSLARAIDSAAKFIAGKKMEQINAITPGKLLEELSTAAARLDKGQEQWREIAAEMRANINGHIEGVMTEQTGDAVEQLSAQVEARFAEQEKIVEDLRREMAEMRERHAAELNALREEMQNQQRGAGAATEALDVKYQRLLQEMEARLSGLTAQAVLSQGEGVAEAGAGAKLTPHKNPRTGHLFR